MLKRLTDIILGLGGLVLTLVFLPFVSLLIFWDSGWPILVGLERISAGRKIKVWKFRSMKVGAEKIKKELQALNERQDGPFFKMKDDPRLTSSGKFLRKYLLDELPQFWNVVAGELSLVGPRPHEPEEVEKYPPEFKHLPLAKAGLTGLSQVSGASNLSTQKEMELDDYYLKNQSWFLDFKIIFRTLFIFLFKHEGV